MQKWINFKKLREQLNFEQVLVHYGVVIQRKESQHQGSCPLPHHQKGASGCFSANLEKGIWQCFGCGAKGNVLDFATYMEGKSPDDSKELREVALLLQERFCSPPQKAEVEPSKARAVKVEIASPVVNAPLDFALKTLDVDDPYLAGRGFRPQTVRHFGLGYCSRGLLKNRIAIPLHDSASALIGYAGRLIADIVIDAENPKYLFPTERERNGIRYQFDKNKFLYHGHQITRPVDDLIIVESFPSVWWLWQHGFSSVVGLMDSTCSPQQGALINSLVKPSGRVWIMPNGGEASETCALSVFREVASCHSVRWVRLAAKQKPSDCTLAQLGTLLPRPTA